jgi:polysaccharide biosynthesis transport protein
MGRNDLSEIETISTPTASKTNLWQTLRRRWLVVAIVSLTAFSASALSTSRKIPRYQSETLILIKNNSLPVLSGTGGNNESVVYEDLSTEIQVLKSRALVSQAMSQLESPYKGLTADAVVGNLYIGQPNKTGILIVSYADTEPPRTKAVLDALGKTYVKYSLERKRSRATNAIKLIEEQLPDAKKKLNESSQALKAFRQEYGLLDPESYGTNLLQRQQSLEEEARQTRSVLEQTQRQYQELTRQVSQFGQDPATAVSESILSQNRAYQSLLERLQDLDAQLAQERIRLQENHPRIENLKFLREQTNSALQNQIRLVLGNKGSQALTKNRRPQPGETQQNLANQLLQLQSKLAIESARLNNIIRAQGEVANRFQQIPYLEQTYLQLQGDFRRNTDNVNYFLTKLQELKIAEAQDVSSWQILEPAYVPSTPISPDYKKDLMMGLAIGSLLGCSSALLLERLDRTIKTTERVKELAAIPLIGTIPKLTQKGKNKLPIVVEESRSDRRSYFTESLRSLAISLEFWDSTRNLQILAFTSAIPKEGKTTLTYNLGLVLADLGQKVLLIDSNLDEPTLHEIIQRSNDFGLTTILSTTRPWREAIHYNIPCQKLDVMTSGSPVDNPVSLLLSDKMKRLLTEWKQAYDYVLIDTPAILSFTEAQSLASRVDGLVLVVGLERCTPKELTRAVEIVRANASNPARMVVNFVPQDERQNLPFDFFKRHSRNLMAKWPIAPRDV